MYLSKDILAAAGLKSSPGVRNIYCAAPYYTCIGDDQQGAHYLVRWHDDKNDYSEKTYPYSELQKIHCPYISCPVAFSKLHGHSLVIEEFFGTNPPLPVTLDSEEELGLCMKQLLEGFRHLFQQGIANISLNIHDILFFKIQDVPFTRISGFERLHRLRPSSQHARDYNYINQTLNRLGSIFGILASSYAENHSTESTEETSHTPPYDPAIDNIVKKMIMTTLPPIEELLADPFFDRIKLPDLPPHPEFKPFEPLCI